VVDGFVRTVLAKRFDERVVDRVGVRFGGLVAERDANRSRRSAVDEIDVIAAHVTAEKPTATYEYGVRRAVRHEAGVKVAVLGKTPKQNV